MAEEYKPIQAIPSGLLGFLQLKNAGRNPSVMDDLLRMNIELRDWYFQGAAEDQPVASVSVATGTVGATQFTTAPITISNQNRAFVTEFSVRSGNLLATDNVAFRLGYIHPAATLLNRFACGDLAKSELAVQQVCGMARDFWLPPSSELVIIFDRAILGANITFTASCRLALFPV